MTEIAQAAGLSVGQIYRYFENKEAIIAAIVDRDLAETHERFAELETSGAPLVETIITRCSTPDCVAQNYDPDRAALALEVLAEAARNPRVAAVLQAADAAQRRLLRRILDEACPSACSETEKAARAEVLSMIFDGMIARAIHNPGGDRVAIGEALRAVMRLLLSPAPLTPPAHPEAVAA
jgi:AcrR family transcriptional regulator